MKELLSKLIIEANIDADVRLVTQTIVANIENIDLVTLKALSEFGVTIPDGHDMFIFCYYTVDISDIAQTDLCTVHLPQHALSTRHTLEQRTDKFIRSLFKLVVKHHLSKPKLKCTISESTNSNGTASVKPTNPTALAQPQLQHYTQ